MDGFGAYAQIALHIAAALAHAVHFGLFEIQTLIQSCNAKHIGNGEDALAAHTGEYDVFLHVVGAILF